MNTQLEGSASLRFLNEPITAFQPSVIQPDYVEHNARVIAFAILGVATGDARTLLHTALNKIQQDNYSWTPGLSDPELQFDARDGLREPILRRLMVVDELPAAWEFPESERTDCRQRVRQALDTLGAIDPYMRQSVGTVIASLPFARLDHFGGGSNSSALGCVWLNPKSRWQDIDWLENIFHEYVHQCLFLDDMCHGIFRVGGDILAAPSNCVRSAILQTERPYDRAFHSAFVSFALNQLDVKAGFPSRVPERLAPLRVTIDQLIEKSGLLTPHGLERLGALDAAVAEFQTVYGACASHAERS